MYPVIPSLDHATPSDDPSKARFGAGAAELSACAERHHAPVPQPRATRLPRVEVSIHHDLTRRGNPSEHGTASPPLTGLTTRPSRRAVVPGCAGAHAIHSKERLAVASASFRSQTAGIRDTSHSAGLRSEYTIAGAMVP